MTPLELITTGREFEGQSFDELDLKGATLEAKEFYRCTFSRSKLQEGKWRGVRFEECTFTDCDLSQLKPGDATIREVRFVSSKLMGVTWTRSAINPRFELEGCDLRYASFNGLNLKRTSFLRCRCLEASFTDCDLSEADFSGSDLSGAVFHNATLAKTDFTEARGVFLDPAKNRVRGVRISSEAAELLASSYGMQIG